MMKIETEGKFQIEQSLHVNS